MDAEGFHEGIGCPQCGSENTVTYRYVEGFSELECPACGYRSDSEELGELTRYQGLVLERGHRHDPSLGPTTDRLPAVPIRALKA